MFLIPRPVLPSATRTVSGESPAVEAQARELHVAVDVTAATGTLDVSVEWSHDGTTWFAAEPDDSFAQITAATKVAKSFTIKAQKHRLKYVLAGTTPSFTFSAVEAVT